MRIAIVLISLLPTIGFAIPTASFTATTVCQGLPTEFTNNSTTLSGSIMANIWDFGDGQGSTVLNPSHVYASSGTFSVTLTVINSQGDVDDFTMSVTVHTSGGLNFLISSPNQCVSSEFTFTNLSSIVSGSFTSVSWNFGDGVSTTGTDANHTYSTFGTYQVTLNTITNNNCSNSFSKTLEVFPEAIVDFAADDVCFGRELQFTNTTTVGSGLVSYDWDFGDDNLSEEINPDHAYAEAGDFTVSLEATTEKGCLTSASKIVTVYPVPEAAFAVSDHCFGTDAVFENQSTIESGTMTYAWDFSDGNTSDQEDPSHLYTVIGNYDVTLTVSSDHACEAVIAKHLYVSPKPIVDFSFKNICFGEQAEFFNNTTIAEGEVIYNWSFGDDNTSQSINPLHDYAIYGTYDVTLEASTPSGGCTEQVTRQIQVLQQPEAAFTAEDKCLGNNIVFENNSVFEGTDITYTWEFGDGQSASVVAPSHQYSSSQTYLVTLVAEALNGCTHSIVKPVKVFPLPLVNFIADDVCDTENVIFKNFTSISSGTLTFSWNFGDELSSEESDPVHLYSRHGNYVVTITATSESGCITTREKQLAVHPLPVTDFLAPAVCDSQPVIFDNTSSIASGGITKYEWDFGDQTNSIVKNPTKAFLSDGSYQVRLVTFSDWGCESAVEKTVTVYPPVIANFNVSDVCLGEIVQMNNTSTVSSGLLTYHWDFGDGTSTVAFAPSHTYSVSGVYNIQLTATAGTGCEDLISKPVAIFIAPEIKAGEDVTVSQGYPVQLNAAGATTYYWEPITGLDNSSIANPVATPLVTTDYIVFGYDSYGCLGSDTVRISVAEEYKLIASNVLTPDNNGNNDTWKVENVETFGDVHVRVYDRWGKLVFEEVAYKNDWRGVSGRDILPDGTYYYYITFAASAKVYKGALTIMRNKP